MSTSDAGRLLAVCTRAERSSAIGKPPVARIVLDPASGVVGDIHGGRRERQVALIDAATLRALGAEVGRLDYGTMGENLVVEVPPDALVPGARLRFAGGALIELTQPRTPCVELNDVAPGLLRAAVGRCGYFASVIAGGSLAAGDRIWSMAPPAAWFRASR